MIVLRTTAAQTLAVGQSLTFTVSSQFGCGECFRNNTSAVGTRPSASYTVSFSANVGGTVAAAPVQLSIEVGGGSVLDMISTPAAVGDLNNVAGTTGFSNCCCGMGSSVTVENTGSNPVVVGAGATLYIRSAK